MAAIDLSAGSLHLQLIPCIGGVISVFDFHHDESNRPILRKCNTPPEKALDACCFPLVPYVNRIRNGRFTVRGREVHLAPNMAGDASPLHGQGWLHAWAVEEHDDRRAVLSYAHQPGEWPWAYEARQHVVLDPAGLTLRLTCRNSGDEPMPCGVGQHPYFPCGPGTRLDTDVLCAWTVDEDVLPVEKVAASGRFDLNRRLVCGQGLDNGFGGWSGVARMSDDEWPFDLRLSSPEAKFFQLYSPSDGGIFVAEPVSHANAALNAPESEWAELGMRVLDPGEEMTLTMRLDVVSK
jgi:aldose 1-epimerase